MSEMAVLHNFSEGTEGKRGKIVKQGRRGCVAWRGEAWQQLVFVIFQFLLLNWLGEFRGASKSFFLFFIFSKKNSSKSSQEQEGERDVATERLELMGGPCCYPRSNKGQIHRPTHTPSLSGRAHTCRQKMQGKGMWGALLPVEYQLPLRGKRVECGFSVAGRRFNFLLLLCFFTLFLHTCLEHESLNLPGGWSFPTVWCKGIWLSTQVKSISVCRLVL